MGDSRLLQNLQELPRFGNLFCLPAPETGQGVKVTCRCSLSEQVLLVTPLSPRPSHEVEDICLSVLVYQSLFIS